MAEVLDWSDPSKLQTRDGRKVVWVADSGLDAEYPVVAYLDNEPTARFYMRSGTYQANRTSFLDIVYAPSKREGWIVSGVNCLCMPDKCLLVMSKDSAELLAKFHGGRVIHIEWEE